MSQSWSETFRALGSAFLGVLRAELAALEHDLARSAKAVGLAAALFVAAAAFGFWTLGVATYFLVQLVAIWLPLWGAALVITALFLLVTGALVFVGWRKLKGFQNPVAGSRRRLDDHMEWWQTRLLTDPRMAARAPVGGGESAARGETEGTMR